MPETPAGQMCIVTSDGKHRYSEAVNGRFCDFCGYAAGEQEDSVLPRTKPWKEHLRERLTTTEDITGYLSACHDEGPEVFRLGIKDVLEFARTPSVSPPADDLSVWVDAQIGGLQQSSMVEASRGALNAFIAVKKKLQERADDSQPVAAGEQYIVGPQGKHCDDPNCGLIWIDAHWGRRELLFRTPSVSPSQPAGDEEAIAREIVTASFGSMPDPNAPAGWRVKLTNRIAAALRAN